MSTHEPNDFPKQERVGENFRAPSNILISYDIVPLPTRLFVLIPLTSPIFSSLALKNPQGFILHQGYISKTNRSYTHLSSDQTSP